METIGKRIAKLRSKLGLTREAFGNNLGVSRDVINNLERDRVNITDDRLLLIAKTYGVRYEWLKNGGDELMYPPETDDFLVRITHIMEGESPNKRRAIEMIMDMPDELLDWVYRYYQNKKSGE
ncbi:MAG: helix-turn-helix transcriptional regulator [Clostridia bacterium]|nr:helix-turn-helix transcriptional regulator [Clostridia bacterium]